MHKIVIMFPGQGSQYVGMGKQFHDKFLVVQEAFQEANDELGYDLRKICFEGPFSQLSKPENIQPAILTVSVALFRVFMNDLGMKIDFLTGHSFGEMSALVCSGAISFRTALRITQIKAMAVNKIVSKRPTTMAAIENVDLLQINNLCRQLSNKKNIISVAAINSKKQIIISGDSGPVKRAMEILKGRGGQIEELYIEAGFHSPILSEAAAKVREKIKKFKFNSFKYPVYSGINLKPYRGSKDIIDNICHQMDQPVLWLDLIKLLSKKADHFLEIGPRTILNGLVPINNQSRSYALSRPDEIESLKKDFGFSLEQKYDFIINCLRAAVCAKNNNPDENEYAKKVVDPYNLAYRSFLRLEEKKQEPSINDLSASLFMFHKAMDSKKVPLREKKERYGELFYDRNGEHLYSLKRALESDKK